MSTMTLINRSTTARKSNLELLRILCMLFIVAHHFGVHGQYGNMPLTPFNAFIIQLLSAGGKLGVNVYVLISGFFLVNSKFRLKKVINTLALTIFYSVSVYLGFVIIFPNVKLSLTGLFSSTFVIYNNVYWFVTCYVAMVILSPFINKLLHAITKREHLILILILTLMQIRIDNIGSYINFSETAWFVTLYIIAAYFRLYPIKLFSNRPLLLLLSILSCSAVGFLRFATELRSIICLVASIFLFLLFGSFDIGSVRFINIISRTTFGIYLIHDNPNIRAILWPQMLKCPMHASHDSFWLFSMVAVLLVFVVCSLIDLLRIILTDFVRALSKPMISTVKHKRS